MKSPASILFIALLAGTMLTACNDQPATTENKDTTPKTDSIQLKEEEVTYTANGVPLKGLVVYNASSTQKRPAIVVVHEWWGLNDYSKRRARELAQSGYIAIAADLYGNGKTADNPDSALAFAMPLYKDPALAQSRIHAAINKLREYPVTDSNDVAAIGYCFGGSMVLNAARLGENLRGVVSFHGDLIGVPPSKDKLKAKVLVCHGEADPYVKPDQVALFKKQMDSVGADYVFKSYPGALHAFTNPEATENGKKFKLDIAYNPAADTASWKDMQDFFRRIL